MPKPLPDKKRAAILADIRAGQKSARQIARDHSVSVGSVTNIAKGAGINDAFERTQTEKATRAREVDCKALRAQLKQDLLLDAQRLRARAWEPYQVVVSTPQGADIVELKQPPLQDARAAYTAVGIAIDKSLVLEKHDAVDGAAGAKSMLANLADALGVVANGMPEQAPDGE
jgi:hypothetical protein